MNKTIAISTIALAMVGCNTETLPDKEGNSFGQLSLSGEARVGETLTTSVTDGNGVDASAITYTWMADGVAIASATSSALVLTEAQAGMNISVTVAYTDNDGYSERNHCRIRPLMLLLNFAGSIEVSGTLESGKLLTATVLRRQ